MSEERYVQVEYDNQFYGGDYTGTGSFILIRVTDVQRLGSVENAFRVMARMEPVHIIHYSEDELYDSKGNHIES
jgi:hypothetical protein